MVTGAGVSKDVIAAIQTVTGADASTPQGVAAAQAAIAGKPELAIQLQQRLAEIVANREAEANREADARRQAEIDEPKKRMSHVGGARQQTITLASNRSPLALGAPMLSGIILVAFATMLAIVLPRQVSEASSQLANILLGTLAAMATQVANYWLGSSSGSASKNGMLADAQAALASSTPALPVFAPIIPAAPISDTPLMSAARRPTSPLTKSVLRDSLWLT